MGFGGPVWHASAAEIRHRGVGLSPITSLRLWLAAECALLGVGDATLGEWRQVGDVAVHVRRRLTAVEVARVGPVCDVRGTWESKKRVARMDKYLPAQWRGVEQ